MKKRTYPKPLIRSRKFGPILRTARETDLDAARLSAILHGINERIDKYEQHHTPFCAVYGAMGKKRLVVFAAAVLLIASAGATAYNSSFWKGIVGWFNDSVDSTEHEVVKENVNRAAGARKSKKRGNKLQKRESRVVKTPVKTHIKTHVRTPTAESPAASSPVKKETISDRHDSEPRSEPQVSAPSMEIKDHSFAPLEETTQSALRRQIELFNRAKEQNGAGRPASALEILNRLIAQYPNTRLRTDVSRLRLGCLYQLKRYSEATVVVRQLIADPAMAGKKAEHLRILGDLLVHQGRCDLAVPYFQRALGLGLAGSQLAAAQSGLKKCNNP